MNHPFIVIESIDAAGGSTQTDLLVQKAKKDGYQPHQYHFPQEDRATGQLIYQKFLHHKGRYKLSRREQALLYMQDFFSCLEDMRALKESGPKKTLLITDRYCTSTFAYQTINLTGRARQKMLSWLTWLAWEGTPSLLKPDIIILLDNPVSISLERLKGTRQDYFEKKEKLLAIRRSYLRLAKQQRWKVISNVDSNNQPRSRQEIHRDIWTQVEPLLS